MKALGAEHRLENGDLFTIATSVRDVCFRTEGGRRGLARWNGCWFVWERDEWRQYEAGAFEALLLRLVQGAELVPVMVGERLMAPERLRPGKKTVQDLEWALRELDGVKVTGGVPQVFGAAEEPGYEGMNPMTSVAFRDAVVDCRSGKVVRRDERWFCRSVMPCDWGDGSWSCPVWEECLGQWGLGCEEWVRGVREMLAYCAVSDRSMAKWFLLYGPPRSGKGTTTKVLEMLLGAACVGISFQDLASRFGKDRLPTAQVVTVGEVTDLEGKDGSEVSGLIKGIVGGDTMTIDVKFERNLMTKLRCVPVIQANEMPKLPEEGSSLSCKMVLLPYSKSFVGGEDLELEGKLREEIGEIAKWVVAGAIELYGKASGERFRPVPSSANAKRDWEETNDPLAGFLADRCVRDAAGWETVAAVRVSYNEWRKAKGEPDVSETSFGRMLRRSGWGLERGRVTTSQGFLRTVKGLRLRSAVAK